MARPLFTPEDLGQIKINNQTITASVNTGKILRIKAKPISKTDFMNTIQKGINRASLRIAADLKEALDSAIRNKTWSTLTGTDDIFDTGELMTSGSVSVTSDGIKISYDAPYANLVHFGGYINPYGDQSRKVYLPPRPWIESVLNGGGPVEQFDFVSYYEDGIAAEFNK